MQRWLKVIMVCAVVGIILSGYAFLHNRGFASGELCDVNATINCDVVNKGPFSSIFGIPVALIGVIGYVLILIGAVLKYRQPEEKNLTSFLIIAATGGLGFSLYLTAIEAFVLHAWCLICLSSQLAILLIFVASIRLFLDERP